MKGKSIKLQLLLYFCFFLFYWLYITRNIVSDINTSQNLLDLVTSYSGYNSMMLHGTVYSLLYLLLLLCSYPKNIIQILTRVSRWRFIRQMMIKTMKIAVVFTGIFTFVNVLLIFLLVNFSMLIETKFFLGAFLSFLCLFFLYTMIGSLFLMFFLLLSELQALIITYVISTAMVCMYLLIDWWSPFKDIVVYDYLLGSGLDLFQIIYGLIKSGVLIFLIVYIMNIFFKEKDILNE